MKVVKTKVIVAEPSISGHAGWMARERLLILSVAFLASSIAGGFSSHAFGQEVGKDRGSLVGQLVGNKVTTDPASGKETLLPAKEVMPGDRIEYTVTYVNREERTPLKAVAIVAPIPPQTAYLGKTATTKENASLEVSIDGGKNYQPPPVMIEGRGSDGKVFKTEAPPERYTHLKWRLVDEVKPQQAISFTYRVTVK